MKQFEYRGFLFVEVPKDAKNFGIIHNGTRVAWFEPRYKRVDLPSGSWSLVGLAKDLKEEEWNEIVESHLYPFDNTIMGFEDYENYGYASKETAIESGRSLILSKGMEWENTLILKNNQ